MKEKEFNVNEITRDDFLSYSRRCRYNGFIADNYEDMAKENLVPVYFAETEKLNREIKYEPDPSLMVRAKKVRECGRSWLFDVYPNARVKNLIKVNRCMDRFCLNCQALAADQRFVQYSPILDKYTATNDIYHVVLTVPNVSASRLADTITLMLDRFSYMIRYFDGRKRVRNLDFGRYGYVAAVRSLEITVSKRNGSYHPHLHSMFILKKGLDFPNVYWNRFSVDKNGRNADRLFSELDLLFQRLWCLLIMRKEVTKRNIEHIEEVLPQYPDGFSCIADLSNGAYHEIFKYAIKGTYKEETLFTKDAFRTMYGALFGRRVYESYGELRRYDFNNYDKDFGLSSPDELFELYIARLQNEELPVRVEEQLSEILQLKYTDGIKQFKYVSRASVVRRFRDLTEEEKREKLESLRKILQ